jgi:hypothetical protein
MKMKARKLPSGGTVRILLDGTVKLRSWYRRVYFVHPKDVDQLAAIFMAESLSKQQRPANATPHLRADNGGPKL